MSTSPSEPYFRFRRSILLVQTKKVISMMAAAKVAENHGDERLDLILTMKDICINSNLNPLTEFTSSSKSTKSLKEF